MSKHNAVAAALVVRLRLIRKKDGYNTDAGREVFRGKTAVPENKAADGAIVLFEDEESVLEQKGQPPACVIRVPYVAEGTIACDIDNPNVAAQLLADDITRALWPEIEDPVLKSLLSDKDPLAYAGRQIRPREGGMALVTVLVKFNATFVFQPGNP